jgi:glycosyltransferase involved in cell wall biosynthesis
MGSVLSTAVPTSGRVLTHPAEPLRILTVMNCSRFGRSGMPTANGNISRALAALGCTVDHLYVEDYPRPVRVRWLNYFLFGSLTARLVRKLEGQREGYDVIQVSGGDAYLAPLLRHDRRGRRRLVVARCHGLEHRYWEAFRSEVRAGFAPATLRHRLYFGGLRLKQVEMSIRGADLLNCHTEADARYAIEKGWKRPDQVAILPSGIEPEWFASDLEQSPATKRLLFCGSWTWGKGARVLVSVFERLAAVDPEVRLTVLGAGSDEQTVLNAFSPDLRQRVTVRSGIPHGEVLREFRSHELLLFTSLFEGYGTVVIEAMAAGLPVVASAVGGAPEYIEHGQNGYLVQPGDVDAFVSACVSLLSSGPAARRALRAAAVAAVSSVTWPRVAESTLSAYAAALANLPR